MTDIKTVGEYTRGPWAAWSPISTRSLNPQGAAFVVGPTRIMMDKSSGFSIADASLIAAAPDLLEALEEIMASYDPYEPICEENAQLARKAIARARGEA